LSSLLDVAVLANGVDAAVPVNEIDMRNLN